MNFSLLFRSSLVKSSLIYGASNVLYTGLPLLLMPFLIKIVQPEDYGLIELFRSFSLVLIPVIGLSTISCVERFYFDYEDLRFKELLGTLVLVHAFGGGVLTALLLSIQTFLPPKYDLIIFLAVIYCLFNQIQEIYLASLRVKNKPVDYLKIRLGSVIIDILFLFIAYQLYNSYDWSFRVLPSVISTVIFGILVLLVSFIRRDIKYRFSKDLAYSAIVFSGPLIAHMLSGYILNISNRFFVITYQGEKELGNFSLAYQIGMIISFFYTSFNMAWTPIFYGLLKSNNLKKIDTIKTVIFLSLLILGGFIFLGWRFYSSYIILDSLYVTSDATILILILSFIILSYYKFEGNYYFYYKRTKELSVFTLISSVLALALNFLLIPKLSTLGAAISTLISYSCLYLLVIYNRPRVINV